MEQIKEISQHDIHYFRWRQRNRIHSAVQSYITEAERVSAKSVTEPERDSVPSYIAGQQRLDYGQLGHLSKD